MKTKEELNAIKEKVEALNKKLAELTEDELKLVNGGHGKNGKPTQVLWDEASAGLIMDPDTEPHTVLGLTPVISDEIILDTDR